MVIPRAVLVIGGVHGNPRSANAGRGFIDENGKERLSVEGKLLENLRGIGSLGAAGVRQGTVKLECSAAICTRRRQLDDAADKTRSRSPRPAETPEKPRCSSEWTPVSGP